MSKGLSLILAIHLREHHHIHWQRKAAELSNLLMSTSVIHLYLAMNA